MIRAAALALCGALIAGCGQTGALFLPGDAPPPAEPEAAPDTPQDDTATTEDDDEEAAAG